MKTETMQEVEMIKGIVYPIIKTFDPEGNYEAKTVLSIFSNLKKKVQGCKTSFNLFQDEDDQFSSYVEMRFPKVTLYWELKVSADGTYLSHLYLKDVESDEDIFRTSIWADVKKFFRSKVVNDALREIIEAPVTYEGLQAMTVLKNKYADNKAVETAYNQYVLIYNAQKNLRSMV